MVKIGPSMSLVILCLLFGANIVTFLNSVVLKNKTNKHLFSMYPESYPACLVVKLSGSE